MFLRCCSDPFPGALTPSVTSVFVRHLQEENRHYKAMFTMQEQILQAQQLMEWTVMEEGPTSAKMRITYFLTFLTFSHLFCHFLTYFPTYISYVPKINKSLN